MRWVAVVFITLGLLAAGCKGSGPVDVAVPFSPAAINLSNQSRLEPAADGQTAAVEGLLSIQGFTVLDAQGLPVLDGPAAPKATARLLDPGDDILSQVMPGLDGRFRLTTTAALSTAIVEVEFRVEEDIDGDGAGEDTIFQRVPVALAPGKAATVELTLAKGEPEGVESELQGAPDAPGVFMVTRYTALDANGQHETFYGTFFANGTVVYDVDGDEFLEVGDDTSSADADGNGWADGAEAQFGAGPGAPESVQGVVTSVNTASQTLTVRQANGAAITVELLPFAGVEVLDQAGLFVGPTSLGQHLVGMQAIVQGSHQPGGTFAASWIVVRD